MNTQRKTSQRHPLLRRLLTALLILLTAAVLLLALALSMDAPPGYLQRRIDFPFHADIRYLHQYDAVGHGKDYNSIRVFQLGQDAAPFVAYAGSSPEWYALPVPAALHDMLLCGMESDPYVAQLLSAQDGFWMPERFGQDNFCGVTVYDSAAHWLYVRTSSYVIHPLPEGFTPSGKADVTLVNSSTPD